MPLIPNSLLGPCKDNGPCPAGAQCYDRSDTLRPKYECICQMGMVMEGNRCISPPPSTPTPRPVPSLSPAIKDTVTALTRTASFVLIGFVTATLVLFAVLKIMDPGRFIHMNIEIALLLAHICLLPTLQHSETACRNISIFIHFFYTAVFAFFLMEGIHMYSLVSRVVPRNGMLSNMGSFMAGWGIAITVITFTVSFEYENYGGDYHCCLQMDTGLMYGEYIPVVILSIITFMLIEAGSNVDDDTMTKLSGMGGR
ncbi:hypothetical protein TCAL_14392 [Tigriopus californicus]|uniref:G-protein coupled receptors family 2 profile 2 domain-containing protein n=1 Tax=Tigriopus californicus TaxID=6832 RepID=A0A553PLA7_TIGCA|nr:hypothetical protein TCAL_14392 [Tigriopus californicus]